MHYTKKWLGLALLPIISIYAQNQTSSIPPNLSILKQELIKYHDSGNYANDLSTVTKRAMYYLTFRVNQNKRAKNPKKLAIVLDIDETALSNYDDMKNMDFGGTKDDIKKLATDAHDPAIPYVRTLYNFAKNNNVAIFFITDRNEELRKATEENLRQDGYNTWADLYMTPAKDKYQSVLDFKTAMRQKITKMGYDIVLNIGDQKSDLRGGFADMSFKLPNPFYLVT